MRIVFLMFLWISSWAHADQKAAHQEGKTFAKQQLAQPKKKLKATDVPGFKTDRPPQAGMTEAQITRQKASILQTNEHAGFVAKTIKERPDVKIDVLNAPSIQCAQKAINNPAGLGKIFCADGNCSEPTYVANGDMMEAVSRLSVLNHIQGEITRDNHHVFKGGAQSCNNYIADFKNCCGSGKGWGKSLGIASCSGEEKILAKSRSKRLCRKIGTYCSKKILGVCVRKSTSFCCFPTRMARVFHEEGRKQLKIGWGDKKHPNCRGFTVDELARIDFSKLDLSEIYKELKQSMKKPDFNKISKSLQNRVETMVIDTEKVRG